VRASNSAALIFRFFGADRCPRAYLRPLHAISRSCAAKPASSTQAGRAGLQHTLAARDPLSPTMVTSCAEVGRAVIVWIFQTS